MKLAYGRGALADLEDIFNHIAKGDPRVARSVIRRIKASLDRLIPFPKSGRKGTVPETYEVVVPNLPFIAVYEIETARIVILAVFHTARNDPYP